MQATVSAKFKLFISCFIGFVTVLSAQETENKSWKIRGNGEFYYQIDFKNPKTNPRPVFVYNHNRNNEVNLNLGLLRVNYEKEHLRANLGVAVGTYMNANYSSESGGFKNIYEANVGFKLSKEYALWLDVGILPSHIGFESAIAGDNYALTRSMMAENSPYFETGAKLSYRTNSGKWEMAILVLNGWQRIQRVEGNTTPAIGHQLSYRPNEKVLLNSSSFIGNDMPDEQRKMRYFHDLYGQFQLMDKFALQAGFDIGMQQREKGSEHYAVWYTPVIIAKYAPTEGMNVAVRGEYYMDKEEVVVSTETANGFQTFGVSLNIDYRVLPNLLWRLEVKKMKSKDAVFLLRDGGVNENNIGVVTSVSISF